MLKSSKQAENAFFVQKSVIFFGNYPFLAHQLFLRIQSNAWRVAKGVVNWPRSNRKFQNDIRLLTPVFADVFDRVYSGKDTSGNAKNSSTIALPDRLKAGINNQSAPALFSAKEMELLLSEDVNPDDPTACAQFLKIDQVCNHQLREKGTRGPCSTQCSVVRCHVGGSMLFDRKWDELGKSRRS